jgi:urease accessory protein
MQIHPTADATGAVLESRFDVEADGELDCVWDPIIPFAGARMTQRIGLHAAAGSRLFWSDALMAGRIGRGEAWQFQELVHELRFDVDGKLIYLERYRLTPHSRPVDRTWVARGAPYVGTSLVYQDQATAACAEGLQAELDTIDGVRAGVDCLAPGLVVGRIGGARGPQFAAARAAFRQLLGRPARRS